MEKGRLYKSKISNTIVMCTKESEKGVFCGLVISSDQLYFPKGYYSETWKDFIFEEISPDQVPGYHTSVKNTHPVMSENTKSEMPASKSKGDVRFIENHRMKLWSDVFITGMKLDKFCLSERLAANADKALAEFDKHFNNK